MTKTPLTTRYAVRRRPGAELATPRSVAGYSKKTQLLYLLIYVTRYLDLLEDDDQAFYLKVRGSFGCCRAP